MAKSFRKAPIAGKSSIKEEVVESPSAKVNTPVGTHSGEGFSEIWQAVSRQFSVLAGAWGFAAIAAATTLFATCYSRAERDAAAGYYGISTSFVPVDSYGAILPAMLALACGAALYGMVALLAIGFSVFKHLSKGKPRRREGWIARWRRRLYASKFNETPTPKIAKAIPALTLIVTAVALLTCVYMAGDYFGRAEARHGKQLLVLSDPKWCPPRPVGAREDCVVIASSGGTVLTRWIDLDTYRLGSATAMWPSLGGGAVTTAMWFPTVRSPVMQAAR